MKNNLTRILSIALVMMLILSCVPTMAFAAEGHAHAAQNISTGAEYASLADAMAAAEAGQTVKVLADSDEAISYGEGVILDLNGHNLTNVTVPAGVTLTAIDSATDDYAGSFGSLSGDIAGTVAFTVKTAEPKSYVSVCENGSWSFHRYYAAITAISLKPATAALGYKAEFYGDETVKNAVVNYGYELWINDYAPKAVSKADKLEKNVLTLRLNNILKEGNDALNAMGSTANINGKAFITLNLNGEEVILYSAEKTTTLRSTIESINAYADSYSEVALQAVRSLCATYAPWMAGWATENIFGVGSGDADLDVEVVVPVVTEGNVLVEDAILAYNNIVATVPAGTALVDGTTKLKLTIVDKASSDSDVTGNEGETLRPLDVHIEGISKDNTTPAIICLGNVLPKALNIGNYDLFHVENGETVPMTHVSIAELDTHNEFAYDPATGAVTIAVASFSEIALRSANVGTWSGASEAPVEKDGVYYIYNADQLRGFAEMVGGINGYTAYDFAGKTVILHADIDLNDTTDENNYVFYPIGYYNNDTEDTYGKTNKAIESYFNPFKGTFDGNGHTISNFYQNTWEMKGDHNWYAASEQRYRDGMGLFGKVYGGTVKNLTVKNFSSDGEIATTGTIAAYADCGATFENITIFNCNPRVYNIGNGGIVGCVGWYAHEQGDQKVTFKNITVDNTNKISALWGSWDVACGGLVGQYYPTSGQSEAVDNLGIHMDNCHVTAQIDVNNDVCANYQYYAYRYAGILIGSVRENEIIDGREYPKMDDLSAENCTVGFGDWNDYYYCELVANSQASYTHDYQFSRLTQVDEITDEMRNGTGNYVIVDGDHATKNATCYHFVDGVEHKHENSGTEIVDGNEVPVEDKQHIYLEFNNLVTGYGWGVTSMGVKDMDGVEILDKNAAQKFEAYVGAYTPKYSGTTVTLGELFYNKKGVANNATVKAFVSPVGKDSTVTATFVADAENWKNSTLTFHGTGDAEIIISDYYFCVETKLAITVAEPVVRYNDYDSVWSEDCVDGVVNLDSADAPSGKTFIGWSETEIGKTDDISDKTIYEAGEDYQANEGIVDLYAVYSYTESGTKSYTLVTNVADLAADDVVVIVAANSNVAMSTTQNGNNRGQANISKSNNTVTVGDDVQLLTLDAGKTDGTYAFYTGSGYLYAAGGTSDNNYLRTKSTLDATGSWNITITSAGVATIKTSDSSVVRHTIMHNSSSNIFSCYASGQAGVSIYKETSAAGGAGTFYLTDIVDKCEHINTTTTTVDATCQSEGYEIVFCNDCREEVSSEILPIAGHTYIDGTCSVCGDTKAGDWKLVTDVNQLNLGDQIIIVSAGDEYSYALSTTQNNNNRGQASVVKDTVNKTIEISDGVQILILEKGTTDGTYAFHATEGITTGYLYAASSGSNYLRTENSLSDNSSWTIEIDKDGVATVIAQGTYTHNLMQYNATNSLFASYASAQKDISIYRWQVYCNHDGEYTTETVAPTCEENGYSYKVCGKCGTHFDITEGEAATGHNYVEEITTPADCETAGVKTYTCSACNDSYTEEIAATGHSTENGVCDNCGETIGNNKSEVVLEITKDDFNSTSYAANNNTKTENGYSYTSYQVMNQSSTMQWQKSKGYITIASNAFTKLELKSTAGTFTVTVGGKTVTGTTSNGVTTYDLTGLTGEIKISVGSVLGKVDYLKFYN